MRAWNWLGFLGPLSLLLTTLGCYPEPQKNPNISDDGGAQAPAFIHLLHAVTDVPALDVYIDKQKQAAALDYRKGTGNKQITPAAHAVELRRAGADAQSPALLSATISVLPGQRTLLAAIGRAAETDGPSRLQLVAAPYGSVDPKTVKLRLLAAAPAAPALVLVAGSNALTDGAEFGGASGYGTMAQLPAATKLGLRPARTSNDLALVTLPAMAAPGSVLTVLALGEVSPVSDDAHFLGATVLDEGSGALVDLPLMINDNGPKGSLALVHAAPDAPAVDVVTDKGTMLVNSLAYKSASSLVELLPGPYTVFVRPAGTMTNALTVSLKILPDQHFTLLAHGLVAPGSKTPLKVTALPRPTGATDGWRVAHTVSDAPGLRAATGDKALRLGYGQGSVVMSGALPEATLTLRVADMPGTGLLVTVPQMVLDAAKGRLLTVVATGTLSDMKYPPAVLAVLDNTATPIAPAMVFPLMTAPAPMLAAPASR